MIIGSNNSLITKLQVHISNGLPVPVNISNLWNFGRCLGLFLALQIFRGLLLASHYTADTGLAFESVISLSRDISWGNLVRVIHLNGASIYFIFLYIHISRGLYYKSYSYSTTWFRGFLIFSLSILVAFLGYVLPWGQIRYWGATVITNLLSALPIAGPTVVGWIWGGFRISNATLSRFFIIHFCVPIFIGGLVGLHIFLLHKTGSQNPSNIMRKYNILRFHPFFVLKDISFLLVLFLIFEILIFLEPYLLGDPENFSIANMISTPEHIVPEWYFLFAYAILRCVPRKGLGVIRMLVSVCVILFPIVTAVKDNKAISRRKGFWFLHQSIIWTFLTIVILLTWLGGQIVRAPFVLIRQLIFMLYLLVCIIFSFKHS